MAATARTVTIVMIAEPTPAQLLPSADMFSLSLPDSVNAGTIDQ